MQLGPAAEIGLGLAAVALLILANGYFVAAEFSFVAARKSRLTEAAEGGDGAARRALRIRSRLSFMLSGAQLGITATSLLVGFIAEPTLGRALRPALDAVGIPAEASLAVSLGLALVIATAAQMVLGELAPKNFAIARAEPVARRLAAPTLAYLAVAGPVVRLFDGASNLLLRLARIEPAQDFDTAVSSDELERIIEASGRAGSLTASQAALLDRALDFRELDAADAMIPRRHITAIHVDAAGSDVVDVARESGHSQLLVVGEGLDDVRGVVRIKDLLTVPPVARPSVPVAEIASAPLVVPETAPLPALLAQLRAARTQLAVVVDEHGGTSGVVSLEDVVEELVGDIRDEHDVGEPIPHRWPDGSVSIPGSWRLDEVEREVGVALPAGDYDTVSGLVMEALGRVPTTADEVALADAVIRVEHVEGHAVGSVRVHPRGGEAR